MDILMGNGLHDFLTDEKGFRSLVQKLNKERGLDFGAYRHKCLMRRVWSRINACRLTSCGEYGFYLNHHPEEYDHLINVLTINVSEFFRNPESFSYVKKEVLPLIIQKKENSLNKTIRIWSAGCSSGEEAYSLAILASELLSNKLSNLTLKMVGTDIDAESLRLAKAGVYGDSVLREVSERRLRTFFSVTPSGFEVGEKVRRWVRFSYHNLVQDEPLKNMDLIVCRNVFIYFGKQLQEDVFMKFHASLNPGGYLMLGKVESVWGELEQYFEMVSSSERIYRKKERCV